MKIVTIDFVNSVIENFDSGVQGEHNATQIAIIPPADMPLPLSYRLAFEPGGLTETLLLTDGKILYELPKVITQNDEVEMTLEGYEGEERVYKSKMVYLYFDKAVDVDEELGEDEPLLRAEISENSKARHTHENKETLNKFGEVDGQPTFDGNPIGGGTATSHEHENKEILDGFSVGEDGQLLHNDEPIGGNDSTVKDITVMYAQDLDGNITDKHVTILYHENAGKAVNPEFFRIQYLPEPQRGDEGKALTVQSDGTYAWEKPSETIFVEMINTDTYGTYSLVDATYWDIDNYINEQKNVILFWKIADDNIRYYTHTCRRSSSGYMSHIFGYHFDVSHESVVVREDGAVVRGGVYTAVSTTAYNKHIEEYNAFVESIPTATEEDNGKILTVQNGAYALTAIPNYEEVGF